MTAQNAGIIGMGHSYPEGILTNADLEKMVDTNDEWITTRTGIKQRHKAADNEYTSQFGTKAAVQALERAGLEPTDIDIIVCATTTPDQIMPSTGALIQAQMGATNAAGMDVFAACSGFIYGITMVESMIRTGQIRYALVVGAEVLTKYVDYTDRGTCVIFGDGAGAAVLGPVPEGKGILATKIKSDGRYEEQLYCPGGGTKLGFSRSRCARWPIFRPKWSRKLVILSKILISSFPIRPISGSLMPSHRVSVCRKKKFIRISLKWAIHRQRRYRSLWTSVSNRAVLKREA
jgi:3-oxoacyl-(acyl-carrier-protein) synthase III